MNHPNHTWNQTGWNSSYNPNSSYLSSTPRANHYSFVPPQPYPSHTQIPQTPTPSVPMTPPSSTSGSQMITPGKSPGINVPGLLPIEESYIENILRLNLGKMITIYMTFEENREWNAKIFKGKLEAAGRDHIIISDPDTGIRYLLLMVNLDYITFEGELQYIPPGSSTR